MDSKKEEKKGGDFSSAFLVADLSLFTKQEQQPANRLGTCRSLVSLLHLSFLPVVSLLQIEQNEGLKANPHYRRLCAVRTDDGHIANVYKVGFCRLWNSCSLLLS